MLAALLSSTPPPPLCTDSRLPEMDSANDSVLVDLFLHSDCDLFDSALSNDPLQSNIDLVDLPVPEVTVAASCQHLLESRQLSKKKRNGRQTGENSVKRPRTASRHHQHIDSPYLSPSSSQSPPLLATCTTTAFPFKSNPPILPAPNNSSHSISAFTSIASASAMPSPSHTTIIASKHMHMPYSDSVTRQVQISPKYELTHLLQPSTTGVQSLKPSNSFPGSSFFSSSCSTMSEDTTTKDNYGASNGKRQQRLMKNRQAAQDSRKRAREHVNQLEQHAQLLIAENVMLLSRVSSLEHENGELKRSIGELNSMVELFRVGVGPMVGMSTLAGLSGGAIKTFSAVFMLFGIPMSFLLPSWFGGIPQTPARLAGFRETGVSRSYILPQRTIGGGSLSLLCSGKSDNHMTENGFTTTTTDISSVVLFPRISASENHPVLEQQQKKLWTECKLDDSTSIPTGCKAFVISGIGSTTGKVILDAPNQSHIFYCPPAESYRSDNNGVGDYLYNTNVGNSARVSLPNTSTDA